MPILGIISSSLDKGPFLYAIDANTFSLARSTDGITWTKINGNISNFSYNSFEGYGAYYLNNQVIVTAGSSEITGAYYTSTNGNSWTRFYGNGSPYLDHSNYMIYDGTKYWHISGNGVIANSTNLIRWTRVNFGASNEYNNNVAYGNNTYFIAQNMGSGASYSSTDGVTWTQRTVDSTGSIQFSLYGDRFVIGGSGGSPNTCRIYNSTNGITWSGGVVAAGADRTVFSIAYNPSATNKYVASTGGSGTTSSIGLYSTDGISWTNIGISSGSNRISVANNLYISAGGSVIHTSTNGTTWTSRVFGPISNTYQTYGSVAWDGTQYIFSQSTGGVGPVFTTTNFTSWTTSVSGINPTPVIKFISKGNNNFFAAGNSPIVAQSSKFTTWSFSENINKSGDGGTYGNGVYVFVGDNGLVRTSNDLITFTTRTSNTGSQLTCAVYVNGFTEKYIIGGNQGVIRTSQNAITWTTRTSGAANSIISLATNGTSLVVAGGEDGIRTSTDGITWTARSSGGASTINNVAYLNNLYLYTETSSNRYIGTSTDGITWTTRTNPLGGNSNYNDATGISYFNGMYIIPYPTQRTTSSSIPTQATYITSTNGITWTSRSTSEFLSSNRVYMVTQ